MGRKSETWKGDEFRPSSIALGDHSLRSDKWVSDENYVEKIQPNEQSSENITVNFCRGDRTVLSLGSKLVLCCTKCTYSQLWSYKQNVETKIAESLDENNAKLMKDPRYVEIHVQGENKHNNEEELQPKFLFRSIWLQNIVKNQFYGFDFVHFQKKKLVIIFFVNIKAIRIISVFQLGFQNQILKRKIEKIVQIHQCQDVRKDPMN